MAQHSPRVLIVDEDDGYRDGVATVLSGAGFASTTATTAAEAVDAATDSAVGVVLLDVAIAGTAETNTPSGHASLVEQLLELRPALRVIALSEEADEERVLEALRAGACDYLAKPLHEEELALAVGRAAQAYGIDRDWTRLRGRLDRLVARLEEIADQAASQRGEQLQRVLRDGVVRAASEVLEAEKTSLMLLDPDGVVLRAVACEGRSMKPEELDAVEVGSGVAGSVFEARDGWVVADAAEDARVLRVDREGRYATPSFVVAPVVAAGSPIGVLCATDRIAGGVFGEEDLALLRVLALQTGVLLPLGLDGGLDADAQEALAMAEETRPDLDGLASDDGPAEAEGDALDRDAELAREICQAATDEVEPERVIRGVLQPLVKLLGAAPASIHLLDPEDGELRCEGACDGGVSGDRDTIAWGRGLTGHVLQTGQLVAAPMPAVDPRFDAEADTPANGEERPMLCVPLKLRGKVIGVCRAFPQDPDDASPRTAEVISAVLSAAVRNALLYRSLVEAIEDVAEARRAARS